MPTCQPTGLPTSLLTTYLPLAYPSAELLIHTCFCKDPPPPRFLARAWTNPLSFSWQPSSGNPAMSDEFVAEVERFAEAVQTHIPDQQLMQWLFENMPETIPALNLGPATQTEMQRCKSEPKEEEARHEEARVCGPEAATPPSSHVAASHEEARVCGPEAATPPPLVLDIVPLSASLLRDEQIAQRQLSPKLHVWQVPELRAFIDCLEDFLSRTGEPEDCRQLAHECTVLAVLLRGVRGLFGIEERAAAGKR